MQDEHGLAGRSLDVDVRRAMIVWVDDHAQAIEAQDSQHRRNYIRTQALGKVDSVKAETVLKLGRETLTFTSDFSESAGRQAAAAQPIEGVAEATQRWIVHTGLVRLTVDQAPCPCTNAVLCQISLSWETSNVIEDEAQSVSMFYLCSPSACHPEQFLFQPLLERAGQN